MIQVQVAAEHYGSSYHSPERYYRYIEQLRLIQSSSPRRVVEVGVGSGFVARELRATGTRVCSVDIDPCLGPDCLGSVESLPLADGCCDVVSCCEVLEHLPFEKFSACLRELARVTRDRAVVSLPNSLSVVRVEVSRGWSHPRRRRLLWSGSPFRAPQPHVFDGQHYWEVGKKGFPPERIAQVMRESGFDVLDSYRFPLNPYHHFFHLRKRPS